MQDRETARARGWDLVALERTRRRLRSAAAAGSVPWLHEEAARRMAERLTLVKLQPESVLDWSGALGGSASLLTDAYAQAQHIRLLAPGEAPVAPGRRWWPFGRPRVATLASTDLSPECAGLVWSNMQLHGDPDPLALMRQWHGALQVGGFLMFSTLGPGSLPELRELYRRQGWGEPMAPLVDMHDLGDQLVEAGFADPVMDQETLTLSWSDAAGLLSELRGLGGNVAAGRVPGLRTPRWREALQASLVMPNAERPSLRFELVFGHAFKVAPKVRVQARTEVSLADMRRMVQRPQR